ncbi:type II toxin-antitoxin system RelB/DinJ family antitoxin [Patescibacteria group bacterium]|nr:type II toxin-antitoxin system RelB/DinJ family antitoxin [Patescibacteria group bacterium]MBU2633243.1 type II toxin-antitoxin system RelB/DinJ family antitoxin [Patescibacteria group bacterium]
MATKTLINIRTDVKLKKEAQALAQKIGVPLSSVINAYLREFTQEQRIDFSVHPTPNIRTRKILDAAIHDIKKRNKKAFSPAFSSVDKAIDWLEK